MVPPNPFTRAIANMHFRIVPVGDETVFSLFKATFRHEWWQDGSALTEAARASPSAGIVGGSDQHSGGCFDAGDFGAERGSGVYHAGANADCKNDSY